MSTSRFGRWGLAALLLLAGRARGDDGARVACATALERAERLSRDGHLLASRRALQGCADEACSDEVRGACVARLADVSARIAVAAPPSIVVHASDMLGLRRLHTGVVTVDGERVGLLDEVIEVDPGAHDVRAELTDGRALGRTVVVMPYEHPLVVDLRLTNPVDKAAETRSLVRIENELREPRDLPDVRAAKRRTLLAMGIFLPALGTAALVGAIVLQVDAVNQYNFASELQGSINSLLPGSCPDLGGSSSVAACRSAIKSERDATSAEISAAVLFGVSALLVIPGIYALVVAVENPKPAKKRSWEIVPQLSPHGAGLSLAAVF